jgi:hypothetical protein
MVNTTAGLVLRMASKLLNMRHFRTFEGFPLEAKTRYKSDMATRDGLRLGLFPPAWPFMPKPAIGQPQFRAYMQQTHP